MPTVYLPDLGKCVSATKADLLAEPTPEAWRSSAYDLIARAYECARKSGMPYEEARSLWSFPFYVHYHDQEGGN